MTHDIPIDAAEVITFEDGIPGFPDHREFVIVNFVQDGAFQVLQSVADQNLSMIVASPWLFFPDYEPELTSLDQDGLALHDSAEAVVFCPVTISGGSLYMNLLGPFVVNATNRLGRQVVLVDGQYEVRTPIPVQVA